MNSDRLANFIIAGVNKAGSTSLFHYLSEHPEVCGSRDKETCYFLPLLYGKTPGPIAEYAAQFTGCNNNKYLMEATPAYFFGKEKIAHAIKETLGPVKVLIILKDPVERLISFYKRKKATFQLPSHIDLKEYVEKCLAKSKHDLEKQEHQIFTGISLGYYDEYINPWFDTFGNQLKVVFFDDLVKHPRNFMKDICSWLEIDDSFYDEYAFTVRNRSLEYRNAPIQKLAVKANKAGQAFWRSNPQIKQRLLTLYYKFNGKPFDKNSINPIVVNFLKKHFKPHNQRLHHILSEQGITKMPEWLAEHELEHA
ncbi:MAG TPA: sulfotransferase domain-containing protein [Bacteroidia bacterium]|nr:sulfotransferase domain-containing protein [Bacteroidia bacterium]